VRFLVVAEESEREVGHACLVSALHESVWIRRVGFVGAVERVESVLGIRIVQVLFEAHGQIASTSRICQVMEVIEVVLIRSVGEYEKLDDWMMKQ
jgi:hypothetical protein